MEVLIPTLLTKYKEDTNDEVSGDTGSAHPPGEGVANKVDMTMFLYPEVDAAAECGPVPWVRVVRVAASETGVGPPHDLLEFPPFAEESREFVVNLWGIGRYYLIVSKGNVRCHLETYTMGYCWSR